MMGKLDKKPNYRGWKGKGKDGYNPHKKTIVRAFSTITPDRGQALSSQNLS